jgi:CelD/BcsL family acetyltransferase involved in cellulose biosynthesis
VVATEERESPALVAPFAAGLGGRHWITLGDPLNDFGEPIVEADAEAATVIAEALDATAAEWSSVRLNGLAEATAGALTNAVPSKLVVRAMASEWCPRVHAPTFDDYLDGISGDRRRRLVTARRRLEDRLAATFTVVSDPAELPEAVRQFEALRLAEWWHRGRLAELPAPVRTARHGLFLRAAVTGMASSGRASVAQVWAGRRLLASAVLLRAHKTVVVALKATDTRLSNAFSAGTVLDVRVIEHAAASGAPYVEFGRGDEAYKAMLGAAAQRTVDVLVTRKGDRLASARASLRQTAGQAEYEWRAGRLASLRRRSIR